MGQRTDMDDNDKVCVLSFDEMKVKEIFEYNAVRDAVIKPSNYAQVVMARGLKKSWKQPAFYGFDCPMTKEILFDIRYKKAGFPVVAVVCDMGSANRKLYKELGATHGKFL